MNKPKNSKQIFFIKTSFITMKRVVAFIAQWDKKWSWLALLQENFDCFQQHVSYYKAQNCQGCPLSWGCHKAKAERIIEINHNLQRHKQNARNKPLSEDGVKHRGQRCADVEATFGTIKHNKGFRRFMLCGKRKVEIETLLIVLAHNLSKISA